MSSSSRSPLFSPLTQRLAGVYCHPTSLPSPVGMGNIGKEARHFLHFLKNAGFSIWQVSPLGPTGYGDSPYQSFSVFAGNPYLLDWEEFIENRWLTEEDYLELQSGLPHQVDYGTWYALFWPVWHRTAKRFLNNPGDLLHEYEKFLSEEKEWLIPYSTFSALKEKFSGNPWQDWPHAYRQFPLSSRVPYDDTDREVQASHALSQFFFFRQWNQLKQHAHQLGIRIMGDLPIYVAPDSADLWAHQELFQLNSKGHSKRVAGVPPDYFSPEGQRWGNPLYNWKVLKTQKYHWWNERILHNLKLFDILRLDHFRGFAAYWSIPEQATTAQEGKWVKGPGLELFKEWTPWIQSGQLVAEDLGLITQEVRELLKATGLPRMGVLQFAFDGNPHNDYLPHNLEKNMVLYTGTHDNNTSCGWYREADSDTQDFMRRYLQVSGETPGWDLIRCAYRSTASWVIFPIQDLLGLGSAARFNTPGKTEGNWSWRLTQQQLSDCEIRSSHYLKELASLYGRLSSQDTP